MIKYSTNIPGKSETMVSDASSNNADFDFDKAKSCADVFSKSTNTGCIIIDTTGEPLYNTPECSDTFSICSIMHSAPDMRSMCCKAHLYGSYQAERFGGKYVFFCPLGMVHWASPIAVKGIMRGAFIGGPVHMVEPDDFLIEDIIRKNNIDEQYISKIMEMIRSLPVIKPDVVNSLSEMLFIVAAHVSTDQSSYYKEEREFLEQQSDISSYIQHIKSMGSTEVGMTFYPIEKEKELLSLISLGDKAGSQKVLNEILGYIFFSSGANFDVIKSRVLELVVLLSRAALSGGADIEVIFGLNYRFLSEIHNFNTVEELTVWLSKIMARFTDCVFNLSNIKHIDVMYRAVDYIKRNYMNKITLEDVASHVYLSPSYFSKIFKDEMKCNFNTYLNNVRIEMSKKLLMDESIPLADVSFLVGYEDQSYFTKVFKKTTGISPGKYRESRGQYKSVQ